jgi:hypothetical protein
MSVYFYANKTAAAFNMSQGDRSMQALLEKLSMKELKILHKHPDLGKRVMAISKMSPNDIIEELKTTYNLDISLFHNDDVWVSTENIEEAIPEWFDSLHVGWFRSRRTGEFLEWAQDFLLQEVRINIWLRYMEHKKKNQGLQQYAGYMGYM